MSGVMAKRILVAIAKSNGAKTVRIANRGFLHDDLGLYKLNVVYGKRLHGRTSPFFYFLDDDVTTKLLAFNTTRWIDILKTLEGKTIMVGRRLKNVSSVEELIIDLELQGFLKKIQYVD